MARSREEVISEMVDSGLFSDDEIRNAAKTAARPPSSLPLAQQAQPVLAGNETRPMLDAAGMVKRLATDTMEGFRPPVSIEEAKRFLNPNAGQYGPNRFAQDVIDTAGQNANKQAEAFVQLPGVNKFPRTAAAIGSIGTLAPLFIPSPKGIQQMAGAGRAVELAKAGEMAIRGVGASLGKAAISTISPASLDAVKARFENPQAVKGALTREQLGNSVVSSANTLSEQIRKLDTAAKNTLSGEQALPKDQMIQALHAIKQRYIGSSGQAVSAEAKGAIGEIDNAIKGLRQINPLPDRSPINIPGESTMSGNPYTGYTQTPTSETIPGEKNRFSDMVSERQTKDVMSQYKNINWDDPAGGAKKEVRKLLDSTLKSENPDYEKAMKPVAARTKLQTLVDKKLSLKYDPTSGTYATDATAGKWTPGLLEGKKPETSMALKRLGELTDNNLLQKARMTNFREQFEGGKTQGSRMVQLGRHVGGVPGAVLGAAMDRLGGDLSGRLIDTLAAVPTFPSMPKGIQNQMILAISKALERRRQNAQ